MDNFQSLVYCIFGIIGIGLIALIWIASIILKETREAKRYEKQFREDYIKSIEKHRRNKQ